MFYISKVCDLAINHNFFYNNAYGFPFEIYISGEVFRIRVLGDAHAVSIELEKQTVRFLDTYNTMVREQTFKITNKSDHLLTYMCMKNESVYDGKIRKDF